MIKIRFGSSNFKNYFNYNTKQRLALLIGFMVENTDSVVDAKLIDKNSGKKYDIDLDDHLDEVLKSLEEFMHYTNGYITKRKNLFKISFGARVMYPITINFALATTVDHFISNMTCEEIVQAMKTKHKSEHPLRYYLNLIIKLRTKQIKKEELLKELEDTAENLGYFKSVCYTHKIPYNFIMYVKNIHTIHLLFNILDDHTREEYPRNTIVTLHNDLNLYHFTKYKIPTYYLIRDILVDKFIYSIYKNVYTDENNETKEIILVDIICKHNKENNEKIKEVRKLAMERYPKTKVVLRKTYIKR